MAMLYVDRARTRMPLVCSVISLLVLTVFVALGFTSWLIDKNASDAALQRANSVQVPQTDASAKAVSVEDSSDRYATESWVRHGREF